MTDKDRRKNEIIDNSILAINAGNAITREQIFSHSRQCEMVYQAQVLVTCQLLDAGFLPQEVASDFGVNVSTIRKRRYSGFYYHKFNNIYRIAETEATRLNKAHS